MVESSERKSVTSLLEQGAKVMAMGYIEGGAKIKRRLASKPWEASAWSFLVLEVSTSCRGGKKLMKIEQVVETSTQAMNVRHGGSNRRSSQDRPMCRFS
jgi:hypothetical protein